MPLPVAIGLGVVGLIVGSLWAWFKARKRAHKQATTEHTPEA